jgi:hypothetical protein
MSTTTAPRRAFDRDETQRRVKHPLQTLRKYIRSYVLLEGLAIAVLFLAAWFWVGLLLDYGIFRLFAFDWLQELREVAPDANNATLVRLVLLGVLFAVLAALVITKVALRWLREFNDRALALVLERRFPRELGDRLITAVELADPRQARQYGYSEAMIEQTILDAVGRVERLPVAEAFNWRRLIGWWVVVGMATLGLLFVVGLAAGVIGVATGDSLLSTPWRMKDVAMIWTERNLLLQDSYWPRRAYLELARFQAKQGSPNEMRVPRDEQRPELQVRAIEWVVADSHAQGGWRPLRWTDVGRFVDPAMLDRVDIPEDWPHWIIDLDDLDPGVPNGLMPIALQDKSAGDIRQAIAADPLLAKNIKQAGADEAVDQLVNWRKWTVDKIVLQEARPEVRLPLRQLSAHGALEEVLARLDDLAARPSMSRTLRKLVIPQEVKVISRGETSVVSEPCVAQRDNKFSFDLNKLKESARLRMRGEDYYTPAKLITLVAPPSVRRLSVDKDEPAYLYHRLQGGVQQPLKGQKQIFRDFAISITGELSTIDVPIGTDLVVKAQTDRKLREPVRIKAPAGREPGAVVPDQTVMLAEDGQSFQVDFRNVVRTLDFFFEFNDEDNVRGRRHIRIRPLDDLPPRFEGDVGLGVILRKPRARGADARATQGTAADGFLITPDALLPFIGQIRDDHGLTRVGWLFEVEPVDIELISSGKDSKDKLPTLVLGGNRQMSRAGLIAGVLQYTPAHMGPRLAIPAYVGGVSRILDADLTRSAGALGETFVMLDQFRALLERRSIEEIPVTLLPEKLLAPPRQYPPWEFNLRDEEGFDVKRLLPQLKVADPQKQGQLHYMLKVSVLASDNNVEGGKPFKDEKGRTFWGNSTRSKNPLQFLVVTENELLAQIALEEESLRDRLDRAFEKLKNAKSISDDQITKLSGTMKDDEMSLVAIRLDDVRKSVIDGGSATREIYAAYSNILKELKVNRVRKDRVEKVEDKIVWPLERTVDPKDGNFVKTDDLFQKAYQEVDDDAQANRGVQNKDKHLDNVKKATKELDVLLERLHSILIAMDEGIAESKLIEILVGMERDQRRNSDTLRLLHRQIIEDLLAPFREKKS